MAITVNGSKTQLVYEGYLLDLKNQPRVSDLSKLKKVTITISSKQLIIREYILKVFPIRLATFRITTALKFIFKLKDPNFDKKFDIFEIDDGCQTPVQLISSDRNLIVTTFNEFLRENIGGAENFSEKRAHFFKELRKLYEKYLLGKIQLVVNREKLLESTFRALKKFSDTDWVRELEVEFENEVGIDWGGLKREWFQLISKKFFDPVKNGLFAGFDDNPQSLVHPNPSSKRLSSFKLSYYEIAGKIVGKCLLESSDSDRSMHMISARFSRSFLAQLIGLRVHYKVNFKIKGENCFYRISLTIILNIQK